MKKSPDLSPLLHKDMINILNRQKFLIYSLMKHLNKFNELNSHTYRRASTALHNLGGIHKDRAIKLQDYATEIENRASEKVRLETLEKAKENGIFLLNAEVVKITTIRSLHPGREVQSEYINIERPGTHKRMTEKSRTVKQVVPIKDKYELIHESPIEAYISGFYIDDWLEMEENGEGSLQELRALGMEVCAMGDKSNYAGGIFKIYVGIEWDKSDKPGEPFFKIVDKVYIDESWNDELLLKFADRRSAVKFKNLLKFPKKLMTQRNLDSVREFFMIYSSASDFDKYFEMLSKININSLYN